MQAAGAGLVPISMVGYVGLTYSSTALLSPKKRSGKTMRKLKMGRRKQSESMFAEKDRMIDAMKKDLNFLESSNAQTENSLAESETAIEQLQANVQRQKYSEKRLFDSFVTQTSHLEQAIFIDNWEQKVASVKERTGITSCEENYWLRLQVERLENELRIQRKDPWERLRFYKEIEFIDFFIDSVKEEDEVVNTQEEKNRLLEWLNEANDESRKLRYILQQGKVGIAQLKDSLAEKGDAIVALTLENEKLRTNEAATNDSMKELKRQIPSHSRKDSKSEEKEQKKKESSSERDLQGAVKLIGDLKGSWKSSGDLKAKDSKSEEKEEKKNSKERSSEKDSKGDRKQYGDLKGSWKSTGDLKSSVKSAGLFCSIPLPVPGISKHKGVEEEHKTDEDLTDSIFDLVKPASGKHHHTRSAS